MDDVYDVMESHLKQQCLDAAGLYNWDRKYYRLAVETGILEVIDSIQSDEVNKDNNDGKLSLRGAKYAKEWSILTPALGSFGFDIVWTSGMFLYYCYSTIYCYLIVNSSFKAAFGVFWRIMNCAVASGCSTSISPSHAPPEAIFRTVKRAQSRRVH